MEVSALEEFIALAQEKSFSRAAEKCFVAQPTLSSHIKALEKELGCMLVDRSRGNKLTQEGMLFYSMVRGPVDDLAKAVDLCKAAGRQRCGMPVRISSCMWHDEIAQCMAAVPDVPFTLVSDGFDEMELDSLLEDRTDIRLVFEQHCFPEQERTMRENGLVWEFVGATRCAVVMGKNNRLAGETLCREQLRGATMILRRPSVFAHWQRIAEKTLGADLGLRFELELAGSLEESRLASFGDTIMLMDSSYLERFLGNRSDVTAYPLLDGRPFGYDREMIYRAQPDNPNVMRAVQALRVLADNHPRVSPLV